MERRPWQVWAAYAACLLVAIGIMGWLTKTVLRLDGAEAASRAKAEIDERVGAALWRMDVALAQLLATEAARPVLAYQPLIRAQGEPLEPAPKDASLPAGGKKSETAGGSEPAAAASRFFCSPLLVPSEMVLLHFEADRAGSWISPQCPSDAGAAIACDQGVSPSDLQRNRQRLKQLQEAVDPGSLLAKIDDTPILQSIGNLGMNFAFDNPNQVLVGNWANTRAHNTISQRQSSLNQAPTADNQAKRSQQAATAAPQQRDVQPQAEPPQAEQQALAQQQSRNPTRQQGGRMPPPARQQQQFGYRWSGATKVDNRLEDYAQRFESLQNATQQAMLNQNTANGFNNDMLLQAPERVALTRSQPVWSDGKLLLVRQVEFDDGRSLQGCWLNWPAIETQLLDQIRDLLPAARLRPVLDTESAPISRMLATLPVELVPPAPQAAARWNSPLRIALWVAWGSFAVAALMLALLLDGVLRLSERRAAFVSAVTHELRTPLTTFRMYSEMLAEGMVPEAKQPGYLATLRGEADRLSHLVENVLQYAKLERSAQGGEMTPQPVSALLDVFASRLAARAEECGLKIHWRIDDAVRDVEILTNAGALEQILFNLVDNACKYAAPASRDQLDITIRREGRCVGWEVRDYGPGVADDVRPRMFQPFSRKDEVGPAPGVGLGLTLCRRLAKQLQGRLDFTPAAPGARFTLRLPLAGDAA